MNVAEFDYELPTELIAQRPAPHRDRSRLLVLDRRTGALDHRQFDELAELLRPGDLLVVNDTRVVPARLAGRKPTGGRVEALLVERLEGAGCHGVWRCLLKASRAPTAGTALEFGKGLRAEVLDREGGEWVVRLECAEGRLEDVLERVGQAPLPPYIRRGEEGPDDGDRERYQTVYARHPGAIAAPTAGLHFTDELLDRVRAAGIQQVSLTLHVGLGTFQPVSVERVEDHTMHEEWLELSAQAAAAVAAARTRGGRVVAVGTTVVRALEACATGGGLVTPQRGECGLFIYPGFHFGVVDAMITNFHLPRSTLLMLVSAFAGRARTLAAYREAVASRYRFYSYGDAMLIEGGR
jgi:S-adenosylmethionine:tRNA ribosyltransferase-isomerase